jgi:hypothetical protein
VRRRVLSGSQEAESQRAPGRGKGSRVGEVGELRSFRNLGRRGSKVSVSGGRLAETDGCEREGGKPGGASHVGCGLGRLLCIFVGSLLCPVFPFG